LYGERVGAVVMVCGDEDTASRVLSNLKRIARAIYSAGIVNDKELFAEWKKEMGEMAGRILRVRGELRSALEKRDPAKDWAFVTSQIGMFSFTGLNPAQVDNMINKWFVFMTKDGRISLAGLNSKSVNRLADAIVDSFKI
jgi:aspartate aminotransferase